MSDFLHTDSTQTDPDQYLWPQYLIRGGGQSVYPRDGAHTASSTAAASQELVLAGFVCKRTETTSGIRVWTGTTAAAATPTLCRMGLYERSFADNSLALVASHANDTTLYAAASTQYAKSWTTPYRMTKGREYFAAILIVTGVAMPTFATPATGWATPFLNGSSLSFPMTHAKVTAQADLPATVANASLVAAAFTFHAILT